MANTLNDLILTDVAGFAPGDTLSLGSGLTGITDSSATRVLLDGLKMRGTGGRSGTAIMECRQDAASVQPNWSRNATS